MRNFLVNPSLYIDSWRIEFSKGISQQKVSENPESTTIFGYLSCDMDINYEHLFLIK